MKLIDRFFPSSGFKSPWLSYSALMIYTLAMLVVTICLFSPLFQSDTDSYIFAWQRLAQGIPDSFRTPLYPLILNLFIAILGVKSYYIGVIAFQCIVFLLTIPIFSKLVFKVCPYQKLTFILTALVALIPGTSLYAGMILTESLSISGIILLLWIALKSFPSKPTQKEIVYCGLILLLLTLLRPGFLCLVPLFGLWWVWLMFKGRFRSSLLACMICFGGVLAYMSWYNSAHGRYTMSSVSTMNNYFLLREYGLITSKHTDNPKYKLYLDSVNAACPVYDYKKSGYWDYTKQRWTEVWKNPYQQDLFNAVDRAMKEQPIAVIHRIGHRAILPHYGGALFCPINHTDWLFFLEPFLPTIGITLGFLLLFALGLLVYDVRHRRISAGAWLTAGTAFMIIFAAVAGAMAEWTRLCLPAWPALILTLAFALRGLPKVMNFWYKNN